MSRQKEPQTRRATRYVLNKLEKLDAEHPGLVSSVKGWLDKGIKCAEICDRLEQCFQVSVKVWDVEEHRKTRWVPGRELMAAKKAAIQTAIELFGGDAGFDAALLAKLWEMMDEMTIPQLISARSLFVRVRAQSLKEQEFLYKTGQLKTGQEEEVDAQTQQRNVLRRIKEIFGLAHDEPSEPALLPAPAAQPEAELPPAPPAAGEASAATSTDAQPLRDETPV